MAIHDYVESRLARLADWVQQRVYAVARYSKVSISSASGNTDTVEGQPNDPNEKALDEEVRRMQSWGVHSVPPKGVETAVLRLGGSPTNSVAIGFASDRYAPTGLNDGELALYNKVANCLITLLNSGSINIATSSGQIVNIQAGTNGIARLNDTVNCGIFTVTAVASGAITIQYTPPGGSMAAYSINTPIPLSGQINSASTKAKCG